MYLRQNNIVSPLCLVVPVHAAIKAAALAQAGADFHIPVL